MHSSSLSRTQRGPDLSSPGHIAAKVSPGPCVVIVSVDRDSVEPCPQNK